MAGQSVSRNAGGTYTVSGMSAWQAERWASVVVLASLALLIAIRMGFRGVNVLGARVTV
jgi:hypothetical protein